MMLYEVFPETPEFEMLIVMDSVSFETPWTRNQWLDEVNNESNSVYVALTESTHGIPMGFISFGYAGDSIELKKIGVSNQFRNRGVASFMIEHLIKIADRDDIHNIIAEVSATNIPAINLYRKFNFHKISVRKKYYANGADALLLQKEI